MKPKEYLKKYRLDETTNFSHKGFIADFSADFMTVLELIGNTNQLSYERFKIIVKEIRQKWDGISNKAAGTGLPESLWNYFYATVVVKARDQLFGEMLKKKHEAFEKKQADWKRRQSYDNYDFFGSFFSNFFSGMLGLLSRVEPPVKSFELLGLPVEATAVEIDIAYRRRSLEHHPDKGGSQDDFIKLTEAKNKCLIYLNSKNSVP